ncbi:MAG TPA: protein kinase [Myxococcaceae bacterium]
MAKKRSGEKERPALDQDGPMEAPPDDDPAFDDLLKKIAQAPSIDPKSVPPPSPERAAQADLSGKQLAHFQVLERIGEGGMGVIYRAIDERLKRTVALKVLPPRHAGDRERNARLWREAQSAAAVNHPHIASIYELGEAEGLSFIAMEYVAGKSLRSYAKGRPLLIGEAVHFARQVAEGLARAHEAGIVHRDLKPDNVMITPDRRVKILDFGLAKLMSAEAEAAAAAATASPQRTTPGLPQDGSQASPTRDGVVLGTPVYMSPEQEKGEPKLDARADIYSFGVMLFEMLTGSPPARHGDPRAHLLYILEGPGKDADPSLVMPLEQVVLRCIEPTPRSRYPNGAAVLEALRAVPIATGMDLPPVPFNVHTSTRQKFFWALAGLVVFLTGCIIAATYIHRYVVARDRRLAAEDNRRKQAQKPAERRLTFNTPEDPILDAALSPDGTALAFVDMRGAHLRTLDPESTRPLKLPDTVPPLQSITWMPSGQEVLLTARQPGAEESALLAASLDGKVRELARGKVSRPQVSPDGTLLAYVGRKGIEVAPLSLDHPRVLVEKVPEEDLSEVHWSPDGRKLLFVHEMRYDEGTRAYLETVTLATGQRQALLENPRLIHSADSGAVAWAPDGRILFALAERPPSEPGFTLWTVSLDPATGIPNTHARMLNSWIGTVPGMLTVAKEDIAYARFEQQTDVYLLDLESTGRAAGTPRRLTMSDRNERPSGWSPDGKSILFVSDQDGSYDLFIQDVVTGESQKLLQDRNSQTWPSFTRQGYDVLYWDHPYPCEAEPAPATSARLMKARLPGGTPQEVLVERHTSGCQDSPSELPPADAYFRCPARSGNCILGETEGLQLAFSLLEVNRNRAHELTRVPNPGLQAHGWDISSDGLRLAIPGASGQVRFVDLSRRKAFDQFVNKACELNAVAFTPNGGGVYSTAECPGLEKPYKLYYSEGLRPPVVLWESASMRFLTPVVSPDGKRLAVGVRPFDNDVWMVSGL